VGYLRHIRRWVVALSRARLGLYVFGQRNVFENCGEVGECWKRVVANGDKLELVSGEMWPTQRKVILVQTVLTQVNDAAQSSPIEGVEHMGQYVYSMIEKALKERGIKKD
jgi:intron-binding protein aquarius